jgi:hypothetical protein
MDRLSSRATNIDDLYQTCEKTYASFNIYNVDPDLITQKLGLQPNTYSKKGTLKKFPTGNKVMAQIHNWIFSTKGIVTSKDLRRHLDWLLDKLLPLNEQILELQQLPESMMLINCVWWSKYGDGGPTIWPEQMEGLVKLNLELSISVGFFGEDTTESNTIKT